MPCTSSTRPDRRTNVRMPIVSETGAAEGACNGRCRPHCRSGYDASALKVNPALLLRTSAEARGGIDVQTNPPAMARVPPKLGLATGVCEPMTALFARFAAPVVLAQGKGGGRIDWLMNQLHRQACQAGDWLTRNQVGRAGHSEEIRGVRRYGEGRGGPLRPFQAPPSSRCSAHSD